MPILPLDRRAQLKYETAGVTDGIIYAPGMPAMEVVASASSIPRGYVGSWPAWWSPRNRSGYGSYGQIEEEWAGWLEHTPQWVLVRPTGSVTERGVVAVVTAVVQHGDHDWVVQVQDINGHRYEWCLHEWQHPNANSEGSTAYRCGGQAARRLFIHVRDEHLSAADDEFVLDDGEEEFVEVSDEHYDEWLAGTWVPPTAPSTIRPGWAGCRSGSAPLPGNSGLCSTPRACMTVR
jgi:hypothetical protein